MQYLGVDCETIGLDGPPYAIGMCSADGEGFFFKAEEILPIQRTCVWSPKDIREMQNLLDSHKVVGHNIGLFDRPKLEMLGLHFEKYDDTLPASHVGNSNEDHELKTLALKYLKMLPDDERKLLAKAKKVRSLIQRAVRRGGLGSLGELRFYLGKLPVMEKITLDKNVKGDIFLVPWFYNDWEETKQYVVQDAERAVKLWVGHGKFPGYYNILDHFNDWVHYERHIKLHTVLRGMFSVGLHFHAEDARGMLNKFREESLVIAKRFSKYGINIDSPQQVAAFFFDNLGMPEVKWSNKTGNPSLDAAVRIALKEQLAHDPELLAWIEDYDEYKNLNTGEKYTKQYLEMGYDTHRITSSINPTATKTTRKSSTRPNLQNISRKKELDLRQLFGPDDDSYWWAIDYSQLELNITAHLAQEPEMLRCLASGEDVFQMIGDYICGEIDLEMLIGSGDARGVGKTINYAITYGAGAPRVGETVSSALKRTIPNAGSILEMFYAKFPRIKFFQRECIDKTVVQGYIHTAQGYRLTVPADSPHKAVDYVVQGTAGIIETDAQIRVHSFLTNSIPDSGVKMIHEQHDEIMFEGPKDTPDDTLMEIADRMALNTVEGLATPVDVSLIRKRWSEKEVIAEKVVV